MAMRPAVRRRALMLIVFSIVQWLFMRYILANGLFNMDTNQRILYFCVSSLGGALLIFVSLIYMVLKGNADQAQAGLWTRHPHGNGHLRGCHLR